MSLKASARSPVVLTETRDLPASVLSLGRHGIRIRVPGDVSLHGELRIAFGPEQMVLTEVAGSKTDGRVTDLSLRYVACWARGSRDQLGILLTRVLRIDEVQIDAVLNRPSGWFYMFGKKTLGKRPEEADDSLRKDRRIPVRAPVDYVTAGCAYLDRGVAYNASDSGMGIMTEAPMPLEGTKITVYFAIGANTDDGIATLEGVVRWSVAGMGQGGGFGLEFTSVSDGANGDIWKSYVKAESEGANVLDVQMEGHIMDRQDGLSRRPKRCSA
ncbi:MAG: hypothetical protein ACI9OJ_002864 [Myxococcota bacterium]|jgi:hypothetical protein